MTPHEFCHWLLGYVTAQPNAVNDDVRCALSRVDMTSFFIPPIPDGDQSPPSSPPAFSPRDPDGWEVPWYWDALTSSWLKLARADVQYYRDLARSPSNPSVRGYYGTINGYPIPEPVIRPAPN